MQEYWNNRFSEEPEIRGQTSSISALHAIDLFSRHDIKSVLVPGSGYGRNSRIFSSSGFDVVGVGISDSALETALTQDPESKYINCSIQNLDDASMQFDAIYCFNTLHLFLENDRKKIIEKVYSLLKVGGYAYFVVCSERDLGYGKGQLLEPNTFEKNLGRHTHYFTERDLKNHFNKFRIIDSGTIEEKENHGQQGYRLHCQRFIFAQK